MSLPAPRDHFIPHIKGNEMSKPPIKPERLRCKPGSRAVNASRRSQLAGGVSILCQAIRNRFLLAGDFVRSHQRNESVSSSTRQLFWTLKSVTDVKGL